jgi:hypothetical protein
VAGEHGVLGDVHLDVEVAGRASAGTDLALPRQLHAGAGVDPGGDLDRDRAAGAHATLAGALAAGFGDDRPVAAAGGTRAHGADLAEEGALHLVHLAPAVAGLAGLR